MAEPVHTGAEMRQFPSTPRLGVGVVIVHDEKFVLIKRGHEPAKGAWTLPGGLVELGEPLHEAVRREICEECGLHIDRLRLIDVVEFIEPADDAIRYHYVIVDYRAHYGGGVLQAADDADDARWFSIQDLEELSCSEKVREVVHKAFALDQKEIYG